MTNLLFNPSFEEGWYHHNNMPELQIPNDWDFWFAPESYPNPIDPAPHSVFRQPEVRVLPREQLPDDERDIFIRDGDYTVKIFKGNGAWYARFSQVVNLPAGGYQATVHVWPDLVKGYDDDTKIWADDPEQRDGRIRFVVDNKALDWMPIEPPPTGAQQNYVHWNSFSMLFDAYGETELGIELMCPFALDNSGLFLDAWSLEQVEQPEPPPDDGRGKPRVQYERTVVVVPAHATMEQATLVFQEHWASRRTVSGSYDDAGIGDLDVRNAILVGIPKDDQPRFSQFYEDFYEGTRVIFEPLPGDTPDPPTPEPPPPASYLGMHIQSSYPGILEDIKRLADGGRPFKTIKIVATDMQLAPQIKAVSPGTDIVFRHVDNNVGYYKALAASDGFEAAALDFLNRFIHGVRDVGYKYFRIVESLNELIGTHDPSGTEWCVNFDIAFMKVLADVTQGDLSAGVLTAAAGNPDHHEVVWLLPAAHAAAHYGAWIMPHTYFAATPTPGVPERWMTEYRRDFAMRPMLSWDPVFKAEGLDLHYCFGEYGAVGVHVNPDGSPNGFAGPEIGWRASTSLNGNRARYIELKMMDQGQKLAWDQENGYRYHGDMIFTTGGGSQWDAFEFGREDWPHLIDRLLA